MLEVRVCVGTNCAYKGGLHILEYLEEEEDLQKKITLITCNCINKECKPDFSPVVVVGNEMIKKSTLNKVLVKIREELYR